MPRAELDRFAARLTHFDFETMARSRAILDTPDGCIARLRDLRDTLGAARLICWFNVGGLLPHDAVLRSMRMFSREVIPALDDDRALGNRVVGGPGGAVPGDRSIRV